MLATPVYGWPYANKKTDGLTYPIVSGESALKAIEGTVSGIDTRVAAAEADITDLQAVIADDQVVDALQTNVAATDTTSGSGELNLSRLVSKSLDLDTTELYLTDIQLITSRTTATNEFEFRLRQGTALSGTVVASCIAWGVSVTTGKLVRGRMLWTPAATETATLHLSVIRNSGLGTMTIFYQTFGQKTRSSVVHRRIGDSTLLRTITV